MILNNVLIYIVDGTPQYHVFIDVFEKYRFADKYSASNFSSVPYIMNIAVKKKKSK